MLVIMIHHYNCLLFIIIPSVMDAHMMLKRGKICKKRVWSTKHSQGMTGRHLDILIS